MIQHSLLRNIAEAPKGSGKQKQTVGLHLRHIDVSAKLAPQRADRWLLAGGELVPPLAIQADADGHDLIAGVIQLELHLLEMPL